MDKIIYYCSNCGTEITENQAVCPKCGVQLEGFDVPVEEAFTSIVKTYDSTLDANIAKDILKEEGIESFINFLDFNRGLSSTPFNMSIHLYVMEKDYEKAFKILEDFENAKPG